MDKLFHAKKNEHEQAQAQGPVGNDQRQGEAPKKESEMDKIKDYFKEDEKLEEEGKEYGGLM